MSGPGGLLLNWNNKSAPGFMHGDDEAFGSVHRVELFDKFPSQVKLTDDVGVMNRAATEDVRSPVWPVVSRVLHTGAAPNARDQKVVDLLDDWVRRDAPRLDADNDTKYDEASPGDHGRPLDADRQGRDGQGARQPAPDVDSVRGLGGLGGRVVRRQGPAHAARRSRKGPFNLRYCGAGSLKDCRNALWITVHATADQLAAQFGNPDPTTWIGDGEPHRLPAGPDPEHDAHDQPADVPAGAGVPAPEVALGPLGVAQAVELELEPREAAAGVGGLASPVV